MVTTIPVVTVTKAEAGKFLVRCEACPKFHTMRPSRPAADQTAREHERGHATPDPRDQVDELEGWQP